MTTTIETASPTPLAAVVARVPMREIGAHFKPHLDKVYGFLAAYPEYRLFGAHNVFIYRRKDAPQPDGKIAVEFGVIVERSFEGRGDVVSTWLPDGRIATATHVGPYGQLWRTHDVIQKWCHANGHALAGTDWEIYGDWNDDPAKLETKVCYLLA